MFILLTCMKREIYKSFFINKTIKIWKLKKTITSKTMMIIVINFQNVINAETSKEMIK
jgi:hypothetical protein